MVGKVGAPRRQYKVTPKLKGDGSDRQSYERPAEGVKVVPRRSQPTLSSLSVDGVIHVARPPLTTATIKDDLHVLTVGEGVLELVVSSRLIPGDDEQEPPHLTSPG